MKKLEDLLGLEKQSDVEIRYSNILADYSDERENTRYRILECGGRYYFHKMKDGEVVECYEVALDRKVFDGTMIFSYTPDDRHIYQIDSRIPHNRNILSLQAEQIQEGDSCQYGGCKVEFVNDGAIRIGGTTVPVESYREFTYKLMKKKIKAIGGARGLYRFLENIAEEGKHRYPLFRGAWEAIREKYTAG